MAEGGFFSSRVKPQLISEQGDYWVTISACLLARTRPVAGTATSHVSPVSGHRHTAVSELENLGGYMARVHKLLLTLASSSALYSGVVSALGLGTITLHSALNQPLVADIQLLEAGDLSADEVRVGLAAEKDFLRSGVERVFFLNDLRFTPLFNGARSVIRVTSTKPIREPYLNFVIEVARPNGKLLREYTLLLDPPGNSAYRTVAELPGYASSQTSKPSLAKSARPMPVAIQGNRYTVASGDSLWLIAQRVVKNAGQLSMQVLMDDIESLNPKAFVAGDRNRLKLGAILLLPDNPLAAAPALAPAEVGAGSPVAQSEIPLEMVGGGIASSANNESIVQAQKRLELELAANNAENLQLQASMLAVQTQLAALQEQVQAKDLQLELLRADLAGQQGSLPAKSAQPLPVANLSNTASAEDINTAIVLAQPVVRAEPASHFWAWFIAGASLLLGACVGWLLLVRGRQEPEVAKETLIYPEPVSEHHKEGISTTRPQGGVQITSAVLSSAPLAPPAPITIGRTDMLAADALEGANIYIAYGRLNEALLVLRKGIQADPQRTELRLRILEVFGELGDSLGFSQEEAQLRELKIAPDALAPILARFSHLRAPQPEVALDDVHLVLDETLLLDDVSSSPTADDSQLNLEDLALDADWDLLSPFKTPAVTRDPIVEPLEPEFASDLCHLPEVSEELVESDSLSHFGRWPSAQSVQDEVIAEEFVDAFAGESLKSVNCSASLSIEHLAASRENLLKLNKALAYIAQGDIHSACSILNEVIHDGDAQQQQDARELLAKIA